MRSIFTIAGSHIALILGAGFATGQEVLQFFAAYGWLGLGGIAIFWIGSCYLSVSLLLAGQKQRFRANHAVFAYYTGPWIGPILTAYTTLFIFSVYVVMLAGAGSVFANTFEISATTGSAIMALAAMVATLFGLRRLVTIVGLLGPLLILLVIYASLTSILNEPQAIHQGIRHLQHTTLLSATDHWWLSGLLYLALQIFGLSSFLPMIGAEASNRRQLVIAGILASTALAAALSLVSFALIGQLPETASAPVPMLNVVTAATPMLVPIYALVILAGIFTTSAPCLWIVVSRFSKDDSCRRYRISVVLASLAGYGGSVALPFEKLVNIIYPTLGVTGSVFILFILAKHWQDWRGATG
jgi:uncharacterized membrane protein YkvI